MFGRLLWQMLRGNRGRLAVALVAVASGAAVISALVNLDLDLERKLTQEFSSLGPNLVIAARSPAPAQASAASPSLMDENIVKQAIEGVDARGNVATAVPYLYIVARIGDAPVVVAGTDLSLAAYMNPTWKFEFGAERLMFGGRTLTGSQSIVGGNVARQMNLAVGNPFELDYLGRKAVLTAGEIVDTGGPEDNQILVHLPTVQNLAAVKGRIEIEQLRVSGPPPRIEAYAAALAAAVPEYDVRPIRAVTEAEGNLLARTRLLIVSMVALILVLTALSVLATMAALAMERREDVGLMKALGGSISRIVALFLAEVGVLGVAGGSIGCVAGLALSRWMGERVFGASIAPRWETFPLTIALMAAVALAGALPLRLLGRVKPAVILRGE